MQRKSLWIKASAKCIKVKVNICHKPQRGFSPKSLQQFAYANLFKFNIPHMCQRINSLKEVRSVSPCECECPRHINTLAQSIVVIKTHTGQIKTMCADDVYSPPALSPLSFSLSQSIQPRWQSGARKREKREQTSVHCRFPSSNERSLHSLTLLSSHSLFQCTASISPDNETVDTHTHTHTHIHTQTHIAGGTAVPSFLQSSLKSSVLCGTPLNNYFYDLLPNDSCWLHNQAKCTAVHIWIYKHIHTNTHNGECNNGSANSHTEMEQVETSSGWRLSGRFMAGAIYSI